MLVNHQHNYIIIWQSQVVTTPKHNTTKNTKYKKGKKMNTKRIKNEIKKCFQIIKNEMVLGTLKRVHSFNVANLNRYNAFLCNYIFTTFSIKSLCIIYALLPRLVYLDFKVTLIFFEYFQRYLATFITVIIINNTYLIILILYMK